MHIHIPGGKKVLRNSQEGEDTNVLLHIDQNGISEPVWDFPDDAANYLVKCLQL